MKIKGKVYYSGSTSIAVRTETRLAKKAQEEKLEDAEMQC